MIRDPNFKGYAILYPFDLVATLLSLLGSIFMCYLYLRAPKPRTTSFKLILATSLADLLYTISNVMSNFENIETSNLCYIEATIRNSSFILSIFFSACVAIVSYKSFLPQRHFNQRNFFLRSIVLGPFVCFFMTIAL